MSASQLPPGSGGKNHATTQRETQQVSLFSDFDLHLFGQGKHYHLYEKMGAHPRTLNGQMGVHFAVWAPRALAVSVIGDFNQWNRSANPLQLRHADLGIWEGFIPGIEVGALYKFSLYSQANRYSADKIDPYAFACELRPNTASIVADITQYQWQDTEWIQQRAERQKLNSPISIYEVHLGSWRQVPERHQPGAAEEDRFMTYRELADALSTYVKEMGFTHIELMPITEYPYDGSWGYQVTGYFAPTSRFGTPEDFQYFIDTMHQNEIGVILDWVPAHFPKDAHALAHYDGGPLYEYSDWRKGEHKQWGTYVFDYGRNEVKNFLISSALFWLREYHIDGIRVDAVASMLYLDYLREPHEQVKNQYGGREHLEAVDFLRQFNEAVYAEVPGAVTIAEESSAWPLVSRPTYVGGLGFTFKWNMGWMHDMLSYMHLDPIMRRYHQNNITFSLMYAFSENFVLPLSHDEVVHIKGSLINKMPGDLWQRFANIRAFFGYMWGHPGKKLLFMGGEFGQWSEWNFTESLDWHLLQPPSNPLHEQLRLFIRDLNLLYRQENAFNALDNESEGFTWIDCNDVEHSVIAFTRQSEEPGETLVFVCNFTPVPRYNYRIGVPVAGDYYELLNSDATRYGGSDLLNRQDLNSQPIVWHGHNQSISLTLSPLSTIILKRRPAKIVDNSKTTKMVNGSET
ncbi:1,4-alpha-glucan branching protein GlgB [Tengunoibacter tsumagoiensis]|uniref:1,4-alpha-glucan branching enzyme GlgB n=1 Tax=Tengunoibacter tsumagoiensis TaxID=2014871 RepID=A0A402A1F1_9CHLR|nr:1,4-alpha-glucan branching protein GlgB [Tengunoibacter tsumagoiensis]GCE12944.1 1,4-alpha-glucan branching enzyme GlgB [Tengunoibacter tsumagoiensis]